MSNEQSRTDGKSFNIDDDDSSAGKYNRSSRKTSNHSTLSEAEQLLIDGIESLDIHNLKKISEKLEQSEDHTEREKQSFKELLTQFEYMKLGNGKAKNMDSISPDHGSGDSKEIDSMESKLIEQINKIEISDLEEVTQIIERLQLGPDDSQDKTFDILNHLKRLKELLHCFEESKREKLRRLPNAREPYTSSDRNAQSYNSNFQLNNSRRKIRENKRFNSDELNDFESNKRKCDHRGPAAKFFVPLSEVVLIDDWRLKHNTIQFIQSLCKHYETKFPGRHPVLMDRKNFHMILEKPYMITSGLIGKRYMMFIKNMNEVYMIDIGGDIFHVRNILFPLDEKYERHLKNTLVDGVLTEDKVDGQTQHIFWIFDIITYENTDMRREHFEIRMNYIHDRIVQKRDKAIEHNYIHRTTQPFLIRHKQFYDLSDVKTLLSQQSHAVRELFFVPKNEPYVSGGCDNVLKWKEKHTINFRLKINDSVSTCDSSSKEVQLFLNKSNEPFQKMRYSPDLDQYNEKVVSCSYESGEWKIQKIRDERPYPTCLKMAEQIFNAMLKPITRQDLCNL